MNEIKNWKWFKAGRMAQVSLENGDDIANLCNLDKKYWLALSMPVKGSRFDPRMLQFLDSDGDGRIRTDEVLAAIEFLKAKGVDLNELFKPSDETRAQLASVLEKQADLAKVAPSADDKAALAAWEEKSKSPEVAVCGDDTAGADAALAAVEGVIDAFFTPPEDLPLVVTDATDAPLPLYDNINPKYQEAFVAFAQKCVEPILGEKKAITRLEWKKIKATFAAYRAHMAAKPVMNAGVKASLDEEEKVLRYKLNFLEFLENYVNMRRLYSEKELAIFQTGTLRIDAKEMNLCFHVDSEAAHSALAEKSKCCLLYLKLSRPAEKAERLVCAVVTAGTVRGLYAGRNGVFYDRDGKDWEAVVTKVVESEVSLKEAFWTPWRKLGEGIASSVKKFLGDKQTVAQAKLSEGTQSAQAGGAAMASSVAAISIGVAMMGAALASIMAAISSMTWWQILVSIVAVIFIVSLPSVILTWFKLRQRDIAAILNASGWAINRPMRFSIKRARSFTKCACDMMCCKCVAALVVVAIVAAAVWYALSRCECGGECAAAAEPAPAVEAAPAAGSAQ